MRHEGQDQDMELYFDQHREGENNSRSLAREHTQSEPQSPQLRCANCDIDILWSPTVIQGKSYCCTGCAAGGPCCCDYSQYHSVSISGVIHYGPDEEK